MARWDQMTVARRQRAKHERKDDEEWLKMTRVTEAQVQAKAAEVARITPTWQEPAAENHRELAAGASGLRGQAPSGV